MTKDRLSASETKLIHGIFHDPIRYKVISELEYSIIVYDSEEKKYLEIDFLNYFKKNGIKHIDRPKINKLNLILSSKINETNMCDDIWRFMSGFKLKDDNIITACDTDDKCFYWFRREV